MFGVFVLGIITGVIVCVVSSVDLHRNKRKDPVEEKIEQVSKEILDKIKWE